MRAWPGSIRSVRRLGATNGGALSKDEVIAQVSKAVEFYRTNGRQHALAAFNSRSGPFAKGMDYVDVHGKKFILEIVNATKSQSSGWVMYMRENPNTGKVEHRIAYWQVQDGLIFKAGTYE